MDRSLHNRNLFQPRVPLLMLKCEAMRASEFAENGELIGGDEGFDRSLVVGDLHFLFRWRGRSPCDANGSDLDASLRTVENGAHLYWSPCATTSRRDTARCQCPRDSPKRFD